LLANLGAAIRGRHCIDLARPRALPPWSGFSFFVSADQTDPLPFRVIMTFGMNRSFAWLLTDEEIMALSPPKAFPWFED